jgi:hypothetical protein
VLALHTKPIKAYDIACHTLQHLHDAKRETFSLRHEAMEYTQANDAYIIFSWMKMNVVFGIESIRLHSAECVPIMSGGPFHVNSTKNN